MQFAAVVRRWLPRVPVIAATAAILIGVFALWTWVTGRVALNQIQPDFAAVQPNAAVCFIAIGGALLAVTRGRNSLAEALAVFVSALASLVFLQHITGIDFGVDELLIRTDEAARFPGRMAANTCFALVLAGVAILSLRRHRLASALLASVVFSVGAVALAGYLFGVPTAFSWGRSTHMAIASAFAIVMVGAGAMAYALEQHRAARFSGRAWAPLLVGLTAALFGIFFSQALRMQEQNQIRRTIAATAHGVGGEIEARFDSMMDALTRLSAYGAAAGWSSREEWRTDARLTVGAFPGFESMEWIDESFTPRIVATRTEQSRHLAATDENRALLAEALEIARTSGQPVVAAPFRFDEGETAFRVVVPVERSDRGVDAYVAAVFAVSPTFAELAARLSPGYATELLCNHRSVFRQGPADAMVDADWLRDVPLGVPGLPGWILRVTPSRAFLASQRSGLPILALSASLVIAALLGLTVRFAGLAAERAERFEGAVRDRTGELESALARLEWENAERRRTTDTLRRTQAVSRYVSGELDLSKVVQAVTDAATALTGAEAGAFFYNPTGREGETHRFALSGVPYDAFKDLRTPRDTELFGPTFRGEQVIRLDDVTKDRRFGRNPPHDGFPSNYPIQVTSYLAVPVLSRAGEVWGGLFFAHSRAGVFTEREEEIAVGLAAQASIAMDNARLYQAERASRGEAQTANRAKDRFLAVLGHELRNPLGSIRNAFEVMTMRPEDDALRMRMQSIAERQLRHLSRLVDDLLDISRIERGKVALQPERIDLVALVREHVDSERTRATTAGLALEVDLPAEPCWIDGDHTRIAQVVGNLLANAVKFTEPGGRVRVSVSADDGDAVLCVRDTGGGIPPDKIDYIFEPFAQTDESLDRSAGGLGLGLPIVKGLVEAHRGTVRAFSEGLGHGSEFVVRLPLKSSPATRAPRAVRESSQPSWRILVIDDHIDSAEGLAELLRLYGHRVDVAHDGKAGLSTAQAARPDVIICDIGLPEMDGYEVAKRLRRNARTAATRLFALTGYGDESAARRAEEAGFDCHLTKPVDAALLRRLLASIPRAAHPATG